MNEVKACLFDLDGVIVDTAKYHFLAWRWLANSLGFDFTKEQNEELKGISRKESLHLILQWGGISLSEEEKESWAEKKNERYLDLISTMDSSEILVGVKNFLEVLKENKIKIALGSSSKNAKMILEKIDLITYFQVIIDGNSLTKGKPDPEVFLLGAEALEVSPKECVVFEDALAGIQAAKAAGMKAIGIGRKEDLPQADYVISSFKGFNLSEFL